MPREWDRGRSSLVDSALVPAALPVAAAVTVMLRLRSFCRLGRLASFGLFGRLRLFGRLGLLRLFWTLLVLALVAGVVAFDATSAAAFLAQNLALVVIGAWLPGPPPLAGPWLPTRLRWLGALAGIGLLLAGLGWILGGVTQSFAAAGVLGYLVLLPIWAWLVAAVFRSKAQERRPAS